MLTTTLRPLLHFRLTVGATAGSRDGYFGWTDRYHRTGDGIIRSAVNRRRDEK